MHGWSRSTRHTMFGSVCGVANVHKLRTMGALNAEAAPIPDTWASGSIEFINAGISLGPAWYGGERSAMPEIDRASRISRWRIGSRAGIGSLLPRNERGQTEVELRGRLGGLAGDLPSTTVAPDMLRHRHPALVSGTVASLITPAMPVVSEPGATTLVGIGRRPSTGCASYRCCGARNCCS